MAEEQKEIKCLALIGDIFGCRQYRIRIPSMELKRHNMTVHETCFLPNVPGVDPFRLYIDEFSKYDLIIIQRCYHLDLVGIMRQVCDFLNIPLVFETDDDYLHIPIDNPAYLSMVSKEDMEANKHDSLKIEELRQRGLENYKQVVSMMDLVTVSTEELKRTLLPYNKNIEVLQNNVEDVYPYKAYDPEHLFITDKETGMIDIPNNMGMITIPSYVKMDEENISPTPRIGWSSTVTHWGQDFNTITDHYTRIIEKYSESCWFVYIGWDRFAYWHNIQAGFMVGQTETGAPTWVADPSKKQLPRRVLHIPDAMYEMYMFHLRNLDIGMAPLAPNVFNMSKSDIKAVEYATWKVPAVLPRFQTYSRNWKEGENCLMYSSGREFQEKMELMINDHQLRATLGQNAYDYVKNNRLERQHSKRRYDIYVNAMKAKNKLRSFVPEKAPC
jgi:hypothetical protein